jgi:hypothetical protein
MIDATTVVSQAIGNDQIRRFVYVIVAGNLIEYRLGQGNMRSLALNDQERLPLSVENNDIRTLLGLVKNQTPFGANERFWVSIVVNNRLTICCRTHSSGDSRTYFRRNESKI